jgi:hypothetical protein
MRYIQFILLSLTALALASCATLEPATATVEVRATWITTTANDAVATPEKTAQTMKRLANIGINTVYLEAWKNGYTQFPSDALHALIGERTKPAGAAFDPTDDKQKRETSSRDLLQEMVIEAHRNGLIAIAWFEYGFMAAHKDTMNTLRKTKPQLMSRDIRGSEVAPNGFVWMNPLQPDARKLLLGIVLEAIDRYDLDGVQLDDRIVWPHVTMGYDDYTKQIYASEHNGRLPPDDHKDAAWMQWRANKINQFAKEFVQEVRAKRPGVLISLSPAVYPWSYENYLLDWPQWAAWQQTDRTSNVSNTAKDVTPRWDEIAPQAYRFSYAAFEKTWIEQNDAVKKIAPSRVKDLVAGIRVVGEGKDSTWDDLRNSMDLTRKLGNAGHGHWFSRGVLDVFPQQLTTYYGGKAASPFFPNNWRKDAITLFRGVNLNPSFAGQYEWELYDAPRGDYHLIGFDGKSWEIIRAISFDQFGAAGASRSKTKVFVNRHYKEVELIVDRRASNNKNLLKR